MEKYLPETTSYATWVGRMEVALERLVDENFGPESREHAKDTLLRFHAAMPPSFSLLGSAHFAAASEHATDDACRRRLADLALEKHTEELHAAEEYAYRRSEDHAA